MREQGCRPSKRVNQWGGDSKVCLGGFASSPISPLDHLDEGAELAECQLRMGTKGIGDPVGIDEVKGMPTSL